MPMKCPRKFVPCFSVEKPRRVSDFIINKNEETLLKSWGSYSIKLAVRKMEGELKEA